MARKKPGSSGATAAPHPAEEDTAMTEADAAYASAVEACDRIIRELEEELEGGMCDGKPGTDPRADR